jgi:ubiquinone/menaquinone biosynthesis C-methylase UbiE
VATYGEPQARTYDRTRGASPTVVALLAKHLGPAGRRRLLDIAGGTGNYARALSDLGFRVSVVDRSVPMLLRAAAKIGRGAVAAGEAGRLPLRDGSADAAMLVSALHQFEDQPVALVEARRVIREGPLVVQAFTKESLVPLFVFEYFPGSGDPPAGMHMTRQQLEASLRAAGFNEVTATTYAYRGIEDGSLAALHSDPALLDETHLRNNSFFHRLDPEERAEGLARLAEDRASGRLAARVRESLALAELHGHGTVFAARV